MLPALTPSGPTSLTQQFLHTLQALGFKGDIQSDYASRSVLATDNSIYQVLPQAVLYPKDQQDLVYILELAATTTFKELVLSPRGGGTGTNGQSLTAGIMVDLSKHMNQILAIDPERRTARVQAGVVKDQLNAALKPHGLFFAPELSTSNRATLGGMINTDASGQGSVLYGKTRDHVLSLSTVLLGGQVWQSEAIDDAELDSLCARTDRVGQIHQLLRDIDAQHGELIKAKFPPLNRCLTGYDLAHIRDEQGRFNLNNILCGSEGTLGFISEATLNCLPIPKHTALVVVTYPDFNAALRHANALMSAQPASIETVDSTVLNLAMQDNAWLEVAEFFPSSGAPVQGINLVEFIGDELETLEACLTAFAQRLEREQQELNACSGYSLVRGAASVNKIWGMRKKAVGLLGNAAGEARPVPFVEDTAVPPEHLADYIAEFRALLDARGLRYGMFGHVDAGVLHVRPALDLKDPAQAKQIRAISDEVAALTYKYGGLLWGEHGKGVRSEYAPQFFGELYPQLQRIKAAFDPNNQLNPGKIATPSAHSALLKIDEVSMRGEFDRQIAVNNWQGFSEAVYCNGNGACYNWAANDPMCPSWKVSRDRVQSPKGRASLIREWLRQMAAEGADAMALLNKPRHWLREVLELPLRLRNRRQDTSDFSHEVKASMNTCLACKSCVGQCPIKVDVPEFRSKFLALYHLRYPRPLKDYLVASLEFGLPWAAKVPKLYNGLMGFGPIKTLLSKVVGFEDGPLLTGINLQQALSAQGIPLATPQSLAALSAEQKSRALVLVQDAFTSYFETQVVIDSALLLQKLGFYPLLAPYQANGKPLHVHGFLRAFKKVAAQHTQALNALARADLPLVGIDPAMSLCFRSEYRKHLDGTLPQVLLLQEFLHARRSELTAQAASQERFKLFPHCTEKTNAPSSSGQWQQVFKALGLELDVVATGCCGMSGTFGHESANLAASKTLFAMSWEAPLKQHGDTALVTGYSCRSQSLRQLGVKPLHPVQGLLKHLNNEYPSNSRTTNIARPPAAETNLY
ncbi:MAG: FAD-binding and (Fe-S)-binding domain-containing protein [Marinagarivorans sp.]